MYLANFVLRLPNIFVSSLIIVLGVQGFSWAGQKDTLPILSRPTKNLVNCGGSAKPHIRPKLVPKTIEQNPDLLEQLLAKGNSNYNKRHHGRNGWVFPSYKGIARQYKKWCSQYGVRFDLAFAQMLHETNYLRFTGSVSPESFNFAGINAPSRTSPGEQYAGIDHGVKAHCQHLAVYALVNVTGQGTRLNRALKPNPVCGRIGDPARIISDPRCFESPYTERVRRTTIWPRICRVLGRPATFNDLGPRDNRCLGRTDARGRCCDAKVTRSDGSQVCLGDLVAWARGPRGSDYAQKIARIAKKLDPIIKRHEKSRNKPRSCDLTGDWTNQTNVTTIWNFTPRAPGSKRYVARERGGCNATGFAVLIGRNIRLQWKCKRHYAGEYEWTLDKSCARGSGSLTHRGERLTGRKFPSTISRGAR